MEDQKNLINLNKIEEFLFKCRIICMRVSMSSITDEIKNRCNIVDVAGRYMKLKRTGSGYMGLCPFHGEKTPSFHISETRQFFHCFGCGESGDVITFVMKMENIDFMTAVTKLSEQYGIDMSSFGFRGENEKNEIYDINRDAAKFFFHALADRPNPGRDYLLSRGMELRTIAKFGLGYADNEWHSLMDHLKSKGYSDDLMYKAGLISRSKGRSYDKFRGRVIFPIINTRGKVVAFGGRAIAGQEPKYLNSPESPAFSKKDNLFGLNLTRDEIKKENQAIIVEGYMDMISLYEAGIRNTAATLGTAMTPNHCSIIGRYADSVVLSYDADAAGRKAALKGIEVIRQSGLEPRVVHVTDGKDPDEFIKKRGAGEFRRLVSNAASYADYRLAAVRAGSDISTPENAVRYIRSASEVLNAISPAEADVYIKKLSGETGISEGAIIKEMNAAGASGQGKKDDERFRSLKEGSETGMAPGLDFQRTFVALAALHPSYIDTISEYERVFTDRNCYRLYSVIKNIYQEEGTVDIDRLYDSLQAEDAEKMAGILSDVKINDDHERILNEIIVRIKINELGNKHRELEFMLEQVLEDDEESISRIMSELRQIDRDIQENKRLFGSV